MIFTGTRLPVAGSGTSTVIGAKILSSSVSPSSVNELVVAAESALAGRARCIDHRHVRLGLQGLR